MNISSKEQTLSCVALTIILSCIYLETNIYKNYCGFLACASLASSRTFSLFHKLI